MMPFASLLMCLVPIYLLLLVATPIVGVVLLLARSKK